VRQLARPSEAGVERLARLPRAILSLVPIRFEQVSAAVGEDYRAAVGGECGRAQQTFVFEVALGSARVLATVVQIVLGHNAKGADRGQHPAFRVVDLVHPIAFSHRPPLTVARQVEIFGEDVTRIELAALLSVAAAAATSTIAIPEVITVTTTARPRIVPVPHRCSTPSRSPPKRSACRRVGSMKA
jgi:hypothetical protein